MVSRVLESLFLRFKVDKFALYGCDLSDELGKRKVTFRDVGIEVWADYVCDKEGLELKG